MNNLLRKRGHGARYQLRFDDLCPTMNWQIWEQVEKILLQMQVQPILAVIPDNCDPSLMFDPASEYFWDRVRNWQRRGWSIAVHGYQHRYVSASAGLLGVNRCSEFAGLPEAEQRAKLTEALAIFEREGVRPDLWVAPGHSFDATTVQLLRQHGLTVISDGFSWRPFRAEGIVWIPQQLWRFRSLPGGLWTICLHHNRWSERDLGSFVQNLARYRERLTSVPELLVGPISSRSMADRIFSGMFLIVLLLRRGWRGANARTAPSEAG